MASQIMTKEEEKFYKELGARLKAARLAAGIHYIEFAKLIGFSNNAVYQWEKGIYRIQSRVIYFYAKHCNIPADELLGLKLDHLDLIEIDETKRTIRKLFQKVRQLAKKDYNKLVLFGKIIDKFLTVENLDDIK